MDNMKIGMRTAGITLVGGGVLLAVVFVLHGPLQATLLDQMEVIGHRHDWSPVHWAAAIALSLFAMAGLIALATGSRLTETVATTIGWALVALGAVGTLVTAVTEATAITYAAATGDQQLFESWWALAGGFANGFALLALGVAMIAANEIRDAGRSLPIWLSWIGAVGAIASLAGWVLSSWMGIQPLSLLWVAGSMVMCLWLAWFGFTIARS
jgi:hypothetical protein